MSKKKDVEKHFAIRCVQRLGYIPDYKELVKKIQRQELRFVCRQSNRVTLWSWKCPINNIDCLLPYDKDRKQIITVLFENSEDYLNNQRTIWERISKG